jgi:hypothetical protein
MPSTKVAIKAYLADAAESWKATYFDKSRFCIVCKQNNSYNFRIRAKSSKKKGISITHIEPHIYSPETHYSHSNTVTQACNACNNWAKALGNEPY